MGISHPQYIREINQHESIRVGLNSTGNVQSDCSYTLNPTTLNETTGANGQLVDLHGMVSDLGIHVQCCTNSDNVIVP